MSLPVFAIRNRAVVIAFALLLMAWGLLEFFSMPRAENPEYTVRTCLVYTEWPGVPTRRVEELVTDKLEKSLNNIEEVKFVRSITSVGSSAVFVEVEDRVGPGEIESVWTKVRNRVATVPMPEAGVMPYVNSDFGKTNVMLIALHQKPLPGEDEILETDRYSSRELEIFADRLRDELKLIPGVAMVTRTGIREEVINVETTLGNWSQLGLTVDELVYALESRNTVAPGGMIDTPYGRFALKPSGDYESIDDISNTTVSVSGSGVGAIPVALDDLGLTVTRTYADPPGELARWGDVEHSEPCVMVAFTMKSGNNVTELGARVKERLNELSDIDKVLPPDIATDVLIDSAVTVSSKLDSFIVNVIEAVLIVVGVVLLMVGFRIASVMAAMIPVIILAALALVPMFGIQLEQISIASFIIALGMLVDNSIQICDQSRRLQLEGKSPYDAAVDGAKEVAFPMLIATGTILSSFLPMLVGLEGSNREFIFSLPVTLSITMALSYLLAMTLCVLLAFLFIRPGKKAMAQARSGGGSGPDGGLAGRIYGLAAHFSIKARFLTIPLAGIVVFACLALPVGSEFFPRDARDQFAVEVWLPEGATIAETDRVAQRVEDLIRKLSPSQGDDGKEIERLKAMRTVIGAGGARWYMGRNPESPQPNYAEILVTTTDPTLTPAFADAIRPAVRHGDPKRGIDPIVGARVIPRQLLLGPPVDAPIGLRVYGSGFADIELLREFADRLRGIVAAQPGVWDVYDSWGSASYQLHVDIDDQAANRAGVTNLDIADGMSAYASGRYLTSFRERDHVVPVYLRLSPEERRTISLDQLPAVYIEGSEGRVPLDSVASIEPRWEPAKIQRRKANRMIEIRARVEDGVLANEVVDRIYASPEMKELQADLPTGWFIEAGGAKEKSEEGTAQMILALAISLVAIILFLIIQYNGFAKPLLILASLPMTLAGALLGLYLTGNPLGFMSQLGILSLFGMTLSASIILVDFSEKLLRDKAQSSGGEGPFLGLRREDLHECLVRAGRVRLLPIGLTTLTTVGGLLPLALGGGPLWEGMAWCMIVGLIVGTLLTLLVVPALFATFVQHFGMAPFREEA